MIRCITGLHLLTVMCITGSCGTDSADQDLSPESAFPSSLHATGRGMITWYSASNGGFEQFVGIPYHELYCRGCHRPLCENCHTTAGDSVPEDRCLQCHGLVAAEWDSYPDVHRAAGMECLDCHSLREMHGDGNIYLSILDDGAMDTSCEECHSARAENEYHTLHDDAVDCSACHVQGVVTCYNCHFETELEQNRKLSYGQFTDWVFLVNYAGKVHAANFQSVKYRNHTFLAMAPFVAHAIARNARTCGDCHNSPAMAQYLETGTIEAARWDTVTNRVTHLTAVIPVPPDWEIALQFDFVDLAVDGRWVFLERGPDKFQMLFGTPLTTEQLESLARGGT
ncbi:MAG: hypothetical protein JSW71_12990 [Gemmatimonadota bacterium]|nr:MAG: hypothetical protein JSW71_12990 [Gemmatimonadota bacterium]